MLIFRHTRPIVLILATVLCTAYTSFSQKDEELKNRIATVRGKILVAEAVGEEFIPYVNGNAILQRTDCKRCIIAIVANDKGEYRIFLGRGKYRVISRVGKRIGETFDAIAPEQPRIINVKGTDTIDFDIKLVIPVGPIG